MAKCRQAPQKLSAQEEERNLLALKEHPLETEFYSDLTEQELQALAESIQRHDLRAKLHVMPDRNKAGLPKDCILDGHQRRKALLNLGWTTVMVVVRYHLLLRDASDVEAEYLSFNADRRHMDTLSRARVALRRFEIEKNRPRGELGMYEQIEARDRIAKLFRLGSGRTASRYWRVLKTPLEVQNTFRDGKLPLVTAVSVARLPPAAQAEVAGRISAGESPQAAVAAFSPKSSNRHIKVGHAVGSLARALDTSLADLGDRIGQVRLAHVRVNEPELRRGQKLIGELLSMLEPCSANDPGTRVVATRSTKQAAGGHSPSSDTMSE